MASIVDASIIDVTAIISALAGLILASFAVIQLRHLEQHRNVDISMKLFEWAESDRLLRRFRWVDDEFRFEDYKDKTIGENKSSELSDYPYEVTAFFEHVGFLVSRDFVDVDVIKDWLGPYIISNWRKLEPWIEYIRKEKGDDTFGEHFQLLSREVTKSMRNI